MKISAQYFNDNSSAYIDVIINFFDDGIVQIKGENLNFKTDIDSIKFSSRLGNTPRVLKFSNSHVAHSLDNDKIDEILKDLKKKRSLIHLLESKMRYALLSGLFLIVTAIFFLTFGSTYAANFIANITPRSVETKISDGTLAFLDKYMLKKSQISKSKRESIGTIFSNLTKNDPRYHLHFRRGIGVNAFALPSGDIVISDELIEFSEGDNDMIYGILAHEMGHVVNKHSMKILVKASIVSSVISYITGDISSIIVTLSTSSLNAKNSREYEHEADVFAKKRMIEARKDPKHLANFFIKFQKKYNDTNQSNFLASHPSNQERIDYLNGS